MFFKKKKEIERLRRLDEMNQKTIQSMGHELCLAKAEIKKVRAELMDIKGKLVASEADVAKYIDLYVRATKQEKPTEPAVTVASGRFKVPHCATCPHHERAGISGRYVHICTADGDTKRVKGNDARISPHWCPLREGKGGDGHA